MIDSSEDFQYDSCSSSGICSVSPRTSTLQRVLVLYLKLIGKYAMLLVEKGERDKNAEELKPRARQNVVFEHGFMYSFLGRNKVVALVEDGVEIPGDLSGVIYITKDPAGNWKAEILKELQASGISYDKEKVIDALS